MASGGTIPAVEGIQSILDTDLYKLTMQCVIHAKYADVNVTYAYTNRTPHMKLTREAFDWIQEHVSGLKDIFLTPEEYTWLSKDHPYLEHANYLSFLKSFRFKPSEYVTLEFHPTDASNGDITIRVAGHWVDTILYEIPLLALVSEAYFKFCDRDWSYAQQTENAYAKGKQLLEAGCVFSEFGTRRRRDYKTQDLVMQGLTAAARELGGGKGKLTGTSNVHLAMKYSVQPVGTVAHEWFMGIAAATGDYHSATERALDAWVKCFGRGVLAIALTDTFGTPTFLQAFSREIPAEETVEGKRLRYVDVFAGVRQDSGDPEEFIKTMKGYYEKVEVQGPKTMVFSDSLNVEKCLGYKRDSEAAGFSPSFGIGTFFTNDFKNSDGKKSEPLNIVIKLSSANGRPAVKLSDDMGKNTGDKDTVQKVKEELGYVDRKWADESSRWSGATGNS